MKNKTWYWLTATIGFFLILSTPVQAGLTGATSSSIAKVRIPFIENQGQVDDRVAFYARTFGGTVFITHQGKVVYSLPEKSQKSVDPDASVQVRSVALGLEFVGSRQQDVTGEVLTKTRVNYFKGSNPEKWQRGLPAYHKINLGEVFNGVTVKLQARGNNVEQLFYMAPGADPANISVRTQGAQTLAINESGELEIQTELGIVKFTQPIAYQTIDGSRKTVDVAYTLNGNSYGFDVGGYDFSKELIIDPLMASTFMGGSGDDSGTAISIDADGNIVIAGTTASSDFPATTGGYDPTFNSGTNDIFVLKMDPDLRQLLACTFVGGGNIDVADSLALSSDGSVYVAGYSDSSDFPTTENAYDRSIAAGDPIRDMVVFKLDYSLETLLSSTYYGGGRWETPSDMEIDGNGNICISGNTKTHDLPTTEGAYDRVKDNDYWAQVGFLAKFDADLENLLAATYFHGDSINPTFENSACTNHSLEIDNSGNFYVIGSAGAQDFPTTSGAYDESSNGYADIFIAKFNSTLSSLLACTYFGGSGSDSASNWGDSILLDAHGNVVITGRTKSTDFPTTPDAYDTTLNDGSTSDIYDIFIAKLDNSLSALLYSTYLGGNGNELSTSIMIDDNENIINAGSTFSSNFKTTEGSFDQSFNGGDSDAYVAKLDPKLTTLIAATLIGGSDTVGTPTKEDDGAYDIVLDSDGNIYVTGKTGSTDFPTTTDAYDKVHNGDDSDVFIAKFDNNLSGPIDFNSGSQLIVSGVSQNGDTYDWVLKKFDEFGNEDTVRWDKRFGLGVIDTPGTAVAVDPFNNVYAVCSRVNGTNYEWWIKKFDYNGNEDTENWNKTFDAGSVDGFLRWFSIAIDSENNVYVVGSDKSTGIANWWIKKFDKNGVEDTANWNLTFDGGVGTDFATSVAIDSNDNVYVVGGIKTNCSWDWWLKKFDKSGNEDTANWNKVIDANCGTIARDVKIDATDNVYVVGGYHAGNNPLGDDWWLKKFDSIGNEDTANWNLKFHGGSGTDNAQSAVLDDNGNVYTVGWVHRGLVPNEGTNDFDWWLKKFDADGNEDTENWNITCGSDLGSDYAYSTTIDANGNIYVAGTKHDGNDSDWWLKKFDANGNEDVINWNKTFDGNGGEDIAYSIATLNLVNLDTDSDGMDDNWEVDKFGDLSHDGTADGDNDGLTGLEEYQHNTDPDNDDSDNDSMKDGWEVDNNLDPKVDDAMLDKDSDNFVNGREYQDQTDPDDAASHLILPVVTGRVPDTGQTASYTDTFGEDSDYLINAPAYIKMDAQGNYLPDSATQWIVVYDAVTGLFWDVKQEAIDNVQAYGNPNDPDNTYTWYDSNTETNGGNAGTPGEGTDTEDFIAALNAANYGGHADWRMPTREELRKIVDYGRYSPSIDTAYFPYTQSSYYWSSDTPAYGSGYACSMNFDTGGDNGNRDKSYTHYVRAVRGGQSQSMDHLTINGDGTVTDATTGFMWEQKTNDSGPNDKDNAYTWESAISWVSGLNATSYLGYTDWRLPTIKEVCSIVDLKRTGPSIDTSFFPNTLASSYWSSTTIPFKVVLSFRSLRKNFSRRDMRCIFATFTLRLWLFGASWMFLIG